MFWIFWISALDLSVGRGAVRLVSGRCLTASTSVPKRAANVWVDRRTGRKIRCITIDNESPEGKPVLMIYLAHVLPASHEQTLELSVLTARSDRGSLVVTGGPTNYWGGHTTHDYRTRCFSSHIASSLLQFILMPPASLVKIFTSWKPHSWYLVAMWTCIMYFAH
jgi:hypothetical protein